MTDNKQNIINATVRLLQTNGLARLTTRKIALEAKVAEGLIYHHFKDKAELIHEVVETRVRETKNIMQNLPLQVGRRTLLENLEDVLYSVYLSHCEISPIMCSVFADQRLRKRMQEILKEREMGPQYAIEGLNVYLAAEQQLGRIRDAVDTKIVAKCLWMISIQSAMIDKLLGYDHDEKFVRREIRNYLQTLMSGFEPRLPSKQKTT
jgi:AcrR family transcriptional regulator